MSAPSPQDVLDFWFGDIAEDGSVDAAHQQRWWKKDPAFDQQIADTFGPAIEDAAAGELDAWLDSPQGAMAIVILLDQFTRNTRRGQAAMYAADEKAVQVVRHAIAQGYVDKLRSMHCYFLWMPLMHSERLEDQDECIKRFEALAANGEAGAVKSATGGVNYAIKHRDIVAAWGRFPHRNSILGRESTPEEVEFLKTPGSSF